MQTSVYDDGSSVTVDQLGNIVSITDSEGRAQSVPGPSGSGVVQQFYELFNYGARAAIDRAARGQGAAQAAAQPAPVTQPNLARYMPLVLLAAAVFVGFKLLK